jgi:DNA polymerase (family 10)
VEAGVLIAIDCDAHSVEDFDELRYGVATGRRGWLTAEGCVNAWNAVKLLAWIKSKRK